MVNNEENFDADEIFREPDDIIEIEEESEEELSELELGSKSYYELDISEEDENDLLS